MRGLKMIDPFDGGDPHGMVFHPDDIREHSSAVLLVKDMANQLEKSYPGWAWAVQPDPRGGVINIFSLRLSGEWGVILKYEWVQRDPVATRRITLAAGAEILERFGMRPGPYSYEVWSNGPKDVAGQPKPDLSDKHTKIQRHHRDFALTQAVRQGDVKIRFEDTRIDENRTHRRILIASGSEGGEDVSG